MREIKFRGKRTHNGEWVYGYAVLTTGIRAEKHLCCRENFDSFWVDGKTVGQFTGLRDSGGKEIYEGDILEKVIGMYGYASIGGKSIATMDRFPGFWLVDEVFGRDGCGLEQPLNWKIIGNIHDNMELIKT